MKTYKALNWNKFKLPEEEWIRDYLWNNYEYFNQLSEEVFSNPPKIKKFKGSKLVLFVFTFNNFETIKLQRELIRKNIGNYPIIYIDDSTKLEIAEKIKEFALSDKYCDYWKVPRRPVGEGIDIYYHNIAINLAYYYIIKSTHCKYFGLLDHDIYPINKIDLYYQIDGHDYYGKEGLMDIQNTGIKYPWPGFSFFHKKQVTSYEFNFFQDWVPHKDNWLELDTGGSMYRRFISQDISSKFVHCSKYEFGTDYFEVIDKNWLHLRDLSNWSGKGLDKFPLIEKCLNLGLDYFVKSLTFK